MPNINVFDNLGRNLINEKLKGSLNAPVLQKCLPVPLLGQASLPISITELCRKRCHREPVTHSEVIKAGAIRLPLSFKQP